MMTPWVYLSITSNRCSTCVSRLLCTRSPEAYLLSLRPLRISAVSALKRPLTAEYAREENAVNKLLCKTSVDCNPLCRCGKEFLLGIDRHDVRAECADAAVGAESDLRHQACVVFVEAFKRGHETFAAQILATK